MNQVLEKSFEEEICAYLSRRLPDGNTEWLYSPDDTGYDVQRALYPDDLFAWLHSVDGEEMARMLPASASDSERARTKDGLLNRVVQLLEKPHPVGGTLQVLRAGVAHHPRRFPMMQTRPEQSTNVIAATRYRANRLRVMRQVHYSAKDRRKSIDLVLFLNGIPVATIELKTDFTQNVADAKEQYRRDRKPSGEPLLMFGTRAVVHFAVSNDEVWMTTRLDGDKTRFLPFNRGSDGHAGNPADEDGGSPTTYLWRDVFQRDRFLDLIGRFVHYEEKKRPGVGGSRAVKQTSLIFPRFHQLDAVEKIVSDARAYGAGRRYLIQHSAGSGKTRSIAWTAHRLATLHSQDDEKVFSSVIVVTDRNVLDAQLQEAIKQIEPAMGVVATVNSLEAASRSLTSKSKYLKKVLLDGAPIIVVTLQTFPFVLSQLEKDETLAGRRFAVIADEAHSSQTGQAAQKLKTVLSGDDLADAEDGGEVDSQSILSAEVAQLATPNISFVAFTATPKAKTLELFGTREGDSKPAPFHVYSMAQAIEEAYILDVLQSYTEYEAAFALKARAESKETKVDQATASRDLLRWVSEHRDTIEDKVRIIIDHYEENVQHLLDGRAKAMVVTSSRLAAVRYMQAFERELSRRGAPYAALVAFSGVVEEDTPGMSNGDGFTEASMNPASVRDIRTAFRDDRYGVLIVANKFQTGFDEPLLCAMYVDRKLSGVTAVQTLSRLNRAVPGKATLVVDFKNSAAEMLEAFRPYYREAEIEETTDPNILYDLEVKLDASGWYTPEEFRAVVTAYTSQAGNNKLSGALTPIKARYHEALQRAQREQDSGAVSKLKLFRSDVASYVRLYDFLCHILTFDDDVHDHAIFFRLLSRQLRLRGADNRVDPDDVQLVYTRHEFRDAAQAQLSASEPKPLSGATSVGNGQARESKTVLLDELVEQLNEQFAGEDFANHQVRSWVQSLIADMSQDQKLKQQARANNIDQFASSKSLRDKLLLAVLTTEQAQGRMTELFQERQSIEDSVLDLIARLVYEEIASE